MGSWFSFGKSEEDRSKLIQPNNRISNSNRRNIKNNKKNNKKSKGIFSFFKSNEGSKNSGSNGSSGNNGNNGTTDSDIFGHIKNIYFQRHAVSCANTIEKVFEKGQMEKTKHAANSGISYVGVQQCLQVCDYFGNFRIDEQPQNGKKPLIIFCCSELTRTHQTLFLSWLKYLKDYKANNGKIIVLPWLNEVSLPGTSKFGITIAINKDNFPASIEKTRIAWGKFIENLKTNIERIKADTLNKENQDFKLLPDIESIGECEEWDKLFYLSPIIFKKDGDQFSNSGKKTPIKRIWEHKKRVGDMKQFIGLFNKILAEYIKKHGIDLENDYNGIQLVLVAHHNSAEHLIKFLMPSTEEKFNEQQLVNCEVVRLPGACLKNPGQNNGVMERIYPLRQELDIQINRQIHEEKKNYRIEHKIFVNPLFILYMSELKLFLSVNNIVKTRLKAKITPVKSNPQKKIELSSYPSKKRIQVKKPLVIFLSTLTLEEYFQELENAKKYIQKLQKIYEGKPTYYNYTAMIQKIDEKMKFLSNYFFKNNPQDQQYQKNKSIQEYIENTTKNSQNIINKSVQEHTENKNKNSQNITKTKNITMKKTEIYAELKKYLFGFCGLEQPDIDSIAVF
jgi:hypothetical protein